MNLETKPLIDFILGRLSQAKLRADATILHYQRVDREINKNHDLFSIIIINP